MDRKDADSRVLGGRTSAVERPTLPTRFPHAKKIAVAAAVVVLAGVAVFAVTREVSQGARAPSPTPSPRAAGPVRPAFTPAEETYIRALWPIHGDVERSTARLTLGQIFYKNKDLDRTKLKDRADEALATYRRSQTRIRALDPPASVRREHEEYLAAIDLFEQSAVEIMKMFTDGRDDHLNAAYPLSQLASNKIREVGLKFWRDEFPAN